MRAPTPQGRTLSAAFRTRQPSGRASLERLIQRGQFDEALKALDSAKRKGDPRDPSWATYELSGLAAQRGRLRESRELRRQAMRWIRPPAPRSQMCSRGQRAQ